MHPPVKVAHSIYKKFFQQKHFLYYTPAFLFFLLVTLGVAYTFQSLPRETAQASSSELGIAVPSPRGALGGLVVPASCASTIHSSADEFAGCSSCNVCGTCNSGQSQCGGACSVGAPALPNGYDTVCTTTNACGDVGFGRVQCNGSCNATAPALPAGYGTPCPCGGTIMCNGSCSVAYSTLRPSTQADPDGGKVVPGSIYKAPDTVGNYCFMNTSSNTIFVPANTRTEFINFWQNRPGSMVELPDPNAGGGGGGGGGGI